jgi:hypothetical protein
VDTLSQNSSCIFSFEAKGGIMQNTGDSMGQVEMQQTIQDCLDCHRVLIDTANHYKQPGNEQHRTMLLDCAEMCLTTAHFMQHNSPLHGYMCQVCAQVCNHCAGESDRMGDTDAANACRNCAWSCEQMAKTVS